MIIEGKFCLFFHKNLCCGCSLESPWQGDSMPLQGDSNEGLGKAVLTSTHNIGFMKI